MHRQRAEEAPDEHRHERVGAQPTWRPHRHRSAQHAAPHAAGTQQKAEGARRTERRRRGQRDKDDAQERRPQETTGDARDGSGQDGGRRAAASPSPDLSSNGRLGGLRGPTGDLVHMEPAATRQSTTPPRHTRHAAAARRGRKRAAGRERQAREEAGGAWAWRGRETRCIWRESRMWRVVVFSSSGKAADGTEGGRRGGEARARRVAVWVRRPESQWHVVADVSRRGGLTPTCREGEATQRGRGQRQRG
jgi:hypothetical protein